MAACGGGGASTGTGGGPGSAGHNGTAGQNGAAGTNGSAGAAGAIPPAGGGSLADCPAFGSGTALSICTATYLTDQADDVPGGTAIGGDGAIIYAGTLRQDSYVLTANDLLGGGTAGVLRLSPDGRKPLSVTRLGTSARDVAVNRKTGTIAVAGSFGVAVLDATASQLKWSKDLGGEATRVEIGSDDTVAALVANTVSVFDGAGQTKATISAGPNAADVAVHGPSQTVIVTGFKQDDGGGCSQLQIPYLRAYAYDGTKKWTDYDWIHAQVAAVNECADSRGVALAIGEDDKLYLGGRSDGGNTVYNRMPTDLSQNAPNVVADKYTNAYNMNGAASVAYIARLDAATGTIEAGQKYIVRITGTDKGNTMRINSLTANGDGTILVAGDSACCIPDATSVTVNGQPAFGSYAGGGYILVLPADLKSRIGWTVLRGATGDSESPVSVAAAGGAMTVLMKQSAKTGTTPVAIADMPMLTVNPLQAAPGGGAADGYLAVWRAP